MDSIAGYGPLVPIGSGGTAMVYRAAQEAAAGREVAVKVLTAPAIDQRSRKRFDRESQALATLGWHPNIVVLFDAGTTAGGAPYIAMEYVPGGSLADRTPMPAPVVTETGVRIADALHCAHDNGVLHRDVKPANILLDAAGAVKLADFGISGLVDKTNTTGGGMTLAHVAPEVVDGGVAVVRSDVYSLASTMFELLVGRAPFLGDDPDAMVAVLLRILDHPVPDLRAEGVPASLAAVLEGAMAKDPTARPDAATFGRQLQEVQRAEGWGATALPGAGGAAGSISSPPPPRSPGPDDTIPMSSRPELPER